MSSFVSFVFFTAQTLLVYHLKQICLTVFPLLRSRLITVLKSAFAPADFSPRPK